MLSEGAIAFSISIMGPYENKFIKPCVEQQKVPKLSVHTKVNT